MLCTDPQSRLCRRISNTLEHEIKGAQRYASPLATDGSKKPMLYRIPLRGPRWVVTKCNRKVMSIGEFDLEFSLKKTRPAIIAASRIGQDQELISQRKMFPPLCTPPVFDSVCSELCCVCRGTNVNKAVVPCYIVNSVRGCKALCILSEIVCVDLDRIATPSRAFVGKVANQFFLLGIHANDGKTSGQERLTRRLDVGELPVSVGVRRPRVPLPVGL
jgi:hypothetical protein